MKRHQVQLEARWDQLQEKRTLFYSELMSLASISTRTDRVRLQRLARWFRHSRPYADAVQRADVLACCVGAIGPNGEIDVAKGVRNGAKEFLFVAISRKGLVELWRVSILILFSIVALSVAWAVGVIPFFEGNYEMFGIQLPRLTEFVIRFSRAIGNIWIPTAAACLGVVLVTSAAGWFTRHTRSYSEYWIEKLVKSEKARVADFCWHLRQLLVAGEAWGDAVLLASEVQNLKLFDRRVIHEDPFRVGETRVETLPALASRYPLVDFTMTVDQPDAKIELLFEITNSLWSRCRTTTEWWIGWFNSLLFWGTLWLVGTVVLALLMPLLRIVSGLV